MQWNFSVNEAWQAARLVPSAQQLDMVVLYMQWVLEVRIQHEVTIEIHILGEILGPSVTQCVYASARHDNVVLRE